MPRNGVVVSAAAARCLCLVWRAGRQARPGYGPAQTDSRRRRRGERRHLSALTVQLTTTDYTEGKLAANTTAIAYTGLMSPDHTIDILPLMWCNNRLVWRDGKGTDRSVCTYT